MAKPNDRIGFYELFGVLPNTRKTIDSGKTRKSKTKQQTRGGIQPISPTIVPTQPSPMVTRVSGPRSARRPTGQHWGAESLPSVSSPKKKPRR